MYENRNGFDFKAVEYDGSTHLSWIVGHGTDRHEQPGAGVILGNDYVQKTVVAMPQTISEFNMHEFNLVDNAQHALAVTFKTKLMSLLDLGIPHTYSKIGTGGFEEIDVKTGETLFEWNSMDQIKLHESTFFPLKGPSKDPGGWDYAHLNSVDKDANGDYLISSRFTNCLYKISGKDGSILWRLGGVDSDFILDGFTFTRQHHARFVESHDNYTIVSFLNNASDESSQSDTVSSAVYVKCTTTDAPWTCQIEKRYNRPDGLLTRLRGSVQTLPNDHVFVSWSENSYHSEFTAEGEVVMEAEFASKRYSTYRSYKFNFTGMPAEPPVLKTFAFGAKADAVTTVAYVSWNGATEVRSWNFWTDPETANTTRTLIANVPRSGFETEYMMDGYYAHVWAEGLDKDGNSLGASRMAHIEVPEEWEEGDFLSEVEAAHKDAIAGHISDAETTTTTSPTEDETTMTETSTSNYDKALTLLKSPAGSFFLVLVFLVFAASIILFIYSIYRIRAAQRYMHVPAEEEAHMLRDNEADAMERETKVRFMDQRFSSSSSEGARSSEDTVALMEGHE